jgi:hypothetical protein
MLKKKSCRRQSDQRKYSIIFLQKNRIFLEPKMIVYCTRIRKICHFPCFLGQRNIHENTLYAITITAIFGIILLLPTGQQKSFLGQTFLYKDNTWSSLIPPKKIESQEFLLALFKKVNCIRNYRTNLFHDSNSICLNLNSRRTNKNPVVEPWASSSTPWHEENNVCLR